MGNNLRDGHIHSPYCPHGSKDIFEEYVKKALEKGLSEISFTEHLPLPKNFISDDIIKESSPSHEEFKKYIEECKKIKEKFKDKIKINVGAEVDYIEGLEKETRAILYKYGMDFDDSILSVHFLKIEDKYYAVDSGKEDFKKLIDLLGGVDKVYDKYYDTLLKSIKSDIGVFKPKRIGHPTLVRRYNKAYPCEYKNDEKIEHIVKKIKSKNYEIDYNKAGLRKQYCNEAYPSGLFMDYVKKYNITLVNGSDSHESKYI